MAPQITPPPDRKTQAMWPGGESQIIRDAYTIKHSSPKPLDKPGIRNESNPMQLHFVMTIQLPANNGFQTGTFNGIYTTKPGQTRMDIYNDVFNMIMNDMGVSIRPNVLFFSLEPNELSTV